MVNTGDITHDNYCLLIMSSTACIVYALYLSGQALFRHGVT